MASTPTDTPRSPNDRKSASDDVFMREVDEAVRQDEVATFVKRFGLPIGVAVVLVLAAFGGWLIWSGQQESKLEESSEQLITALDELEAGNADAANEKLAAIAAAGGKGSAGMARLLQAGIALGQNKTEEAVGLYGQVANDSSLPQEVRDLAKVRMVSANFDNMESQAVIDQLGPLATAESPWFGSAGELVAFAYLAQNKPDQAGPLLVAIAKNEDVPESLRSRTRQLAGLLGHDAVDDVDAMLEELGTPQGAQAGGAQ
ncbi:hypothetical protein D2V17_10830 [Aurantiacibacter xanthus]|uniref:Ancillary SecYEG translocon subunit/Cell division coordinator CpoB TPR domain-containing protein n=1 Tax=Aurantiacibacter xanthus TaxID=1784712 RepID=A0A3A1P348_9SPHN|nr:tetratricopeptide repeat protein [Aurantiacibacter xanthus]RIV85234.1 hypothetical protein D2V17_10830 [Aurantiacibacter xanthus]